MRRRDFLRLTACIPILGVLPYYPKRNTRLFIPYSYWQGYNKWIGTTQLLGIGDLVELNGVVYTVIDSEIRGDFYKHPFMLLDRPLEAEIPFDLPIVRCGHYSSKMSNLWHPSQVTSTVLRSRPLGRGAVSSNTV